MDQSKRAAFVNKMGKKTLRLAKGGSVKRKHFDGGGIAGLLGSAGGAGGTGFNTPSGTNGAQINQAYTQSQNALTNQNALANTLTPQAATAVNAQNVLAGQFANQALGQGPNVATNVLNQATAGNVANQAALMAGQRGAGSNPALIARQAAQQGAATQQQAVGQAATMQAQQQIAAEQAGAQLAGNQIAQTQGATTANTQANQGEQGILQGANTANNNIQGQLANTTMQGQQGLIGGVLNGVGGALGLAQGGEVHAKKLDFVHKMTKLGLEHHGQPPALYSDGGQVPTVPSPGTLDAQASMRKAFGYADGGLAVPAVQVNAPQAMPFQPVAQVEGGFNAGTNAGAQALSNSMKAKPKPDDPNSMSSQNKNIKADSQNVLGSDPQMIAGPAGTTDLTDMAMTKAAQGGMMHQHFQGPHKSAVANYLMNKGGKVPALVSPGEVYLSPDKVERVLKGENPMKIGEKVPGKAKVKGDSRKNDFVPADLDEGGVVIPRHIATHKMNGEKAELFVHRAVAKRKAGGK